MAKICILSEEHLDILLALRVLLQEHALKFWTMSCSLTGPWCDSPAIQGGPPSSPLPLSPDFLVTFYFVFAFPVVLNPCVTWRLYNPKNQSCQPAGLGTIGLGKQSNGTEIRRKPIHDRSSWQLENRREKGKPISTSYRMPSTRDFRATVTQPA